MYICFNDDTILVYDVNVMKLNHELRRNMITHIKSDTISFAWYQLIREVKNTIVTNVDTGSFKDDIRYQFESVAVEITKPYYDMIPVMPVGCEKLQPTTIEYVEKYFENYIIGSEVDDNETYTYGQRINLSINEVMNKLKNCPYNNQMVIEVADPFDINEADPPCLRLIDLKVNEDKGINLHCYFRSWELWAGFPTNLGGLEMLRQYISLSCGFEMEKGKLFAYSSGLHIYGHNLKNVIAFINR
jgi:thymidylate synthase